ncbi:hypothetical protein BFG52_02220 [Acinetobacter larvae]|uniref:TonB-dependent receptor n=1 Tax=Acinetobacter larvae TaxID=1789224 RepID=A0A1B2M3W4_9GAMM|nr:hypothetical protein BFG52_02220 [Acinetobacter larvae]
MKQTAHGYRLQEKNKNTVTPNTTTLLQNHADEDTQALPVISLVATRSGITEGKNSYTTSQMNTATRLNLSMKETPQSTTVITKQRIDDQNMTSINDMVQSAPGLIVDSSNGPSRTVFRARGFDIDNIMYDGLPSQYDPIAVGVSTNMAMLDRVEVVRGATGLITGTGNPSAAINVVRKRPTAEPKVSLTGSVGRWNNYRGEIDASSKLNSSGSVRGRVVGSYQDQDTFREGEEAEHGLLYGALEIDLSPQATLLTGISYQKDYNNSFWGGIPLGADGQHIKVPRSTNPANDWEDKTTRLTTLFTDLEYRFDNDWKLRAAVMKSWNDGIFSGTYLNYTPARGFAYSAYQGKYDINNTGVDVFLNGPYQLFGRSHEAGFGLSQRSTRSKLHNYSGGGFYGDHLDPLNLDKIAKPDFQYSGSRTTEIAQHGFNAMTRLNLADSLKLILGGRIDWYEYKDFAGSSGYKVSDELTSYAGIIYDLNPNHAVYASYTTIFQPQNNKDINRKIIKPITGNNYELGIKGEYFDGALNASAALFRINQENRAKTLADQSACPEDLNNSCAEASGLVRSDGFDLELQGALSSAWQLGAGYSYVKARYKKDKDPAKVGQIFESNAPKKVFKLTSSYILPTENNNWRVGGTLYWQDTIFNNVTNMGAATDYRVEQKAYALLDLMVAYQWNQNLDLQLNINNVFDKEYYRGIASDMGWFPMGSYGDPRNAVFTVRYKF